MSKLLMGSQGAVWINSHRLMMECGWLGNAPSYADRSDTHSLIRIVTGNWLLVDECWFDNNHQSGHVQMTWSDIPVFTAVYNGETYSPDHLDFVKEAIRSGYQDPDFFGFRGPESFPKGRDVPDGELHYSNFYSKHNLLLFGDFNPEYRWMCGIG